MGRALPVACRNGGAALALTVDQTHFAVARGAILANEGAINLGPMRRRRGDVLRRCGWALRHVQRDDRRRPSTRRLVDSSPTVRNDAAPPPPAPAAPPCSEKPAPPKRMADAGAGQEMVAEFNKLYETGECQLGYCLADVQVNEERTVDAVRILRPQNVDKRVESAIVGAASGRASARR